MTIQTLLLLFGALLLLIAIVGGGLEVKELKIPKVENTPRIIAAVGGIVFILMAINYNAITIEEKKTTPAASEEKSASQPDKPYHQAGDRGSSRCPRLV